MQQVILIGAGGYAKSVIDSIDSFHYKIFGFIDSYKFSNVKTHLGYPVIGQQLSDISNPKNFVYFICIGNNLDRQPYFDEVKNAGLQLINVIDRSAVVSKTALLGEGCFVGKLAVINSTAIIGDDVILNTRSLVEHGCVVEKHANISTNTVINGDVHVGEGCFIGSSTVINGQVSVGAWTVIGSGSVVLRDVEAEVTAVGSPARIIKRGKRDVKGVCNC